ncbi:MAG TPA: serine hydrolase [Longimicrobiaceae bacterium]|nr:serine hydrolase [Longimicrobiaceae bacterium]
MAAAWLAACGPPDSRAAGVREEPPAIHVRPVEAPPSGPAVLRGPDSAAVRARIDSVFAPFDRPGSPGCVLAVMEAGEIVYGRGYGSADLARGTPLTPASAFDGASMAKQFLTFGIALLAREGKLSLDDPVQKHLPELPDYGATVTLRHLAHHTSGLRDADARWLSGQRIADPSQLPGLSFPPGDRHMYDDTGYALLQRVIERVSGQSWARFARTRIFDPLGMTRSGFPEDDPGPLPSRVRAYAPSGGGYRLRVSGADQGFTTTPEDLAKWDRNFYDARLGGPAVLRMMLEEGRLNSGETIPYALALHTEPYRGLRRVWHGGLAAGYRSQFMRYPDQRTSVLVMCNVFQVAEPNGLAERVTDIVLEDAIRRAEAQLPVARPREPVPAPTPAERERLAAIYVSRAEQAIRPVRSHGDRLEMRQWITWHALQPLGGGRFRVHGQPLTLLFRLGPGGTRVLEEHWDGRRTPTILEAVPEGSLPAAELDRYTGPYRSDELGTTWVLAREGGLLRVSEGPLGGLRLHPAGPDTFTDREYLLVVFRRDPAGRVAGFTAATPRIRNVEFSKRAR